MDQIAYLASEGFGDKLVIAHHICSKERLLKYGSHGYSYIISHIVPRMTARGYSEELIRNILVDNPARILTFTDPKSD
jgi:phosphotriesterase-related protein